MAPKFRWLTFGFIASCLMMMRMQVELITYTGHDTGFLRLMDAPAHTRGLITYGIFIALFLVIANFSSRTRKVVYLAASITIFFTAFLVSTIIMVL